MEKTFGTLLREGRRKLKLTTEELAKKAVIDRTYITKIERHNKLPSPLVMKKIIDVLGEPNLFGAYLKIKYPTFHEQFKKEDYDITREFNRMTRDIARKKSRTPEEERELERRVRNMMFRTVELINRYQEVLVELEKIEKRYLRSKKLTSQEIEKKLSFHS